MTATVQFFGPLRSMVGATEMRLELSSGASVADLLEQVYQRFPRLREADRSLLIAVGVEFARRSDPLADGAVVSLMPPVQGGSDAPVANDDELLITEEPIAATEANTGRGGGDVGAVVVFWGIVRDREDERPITALEYTAYRAMAEHQFRKQLAVARQRWPVKRIRVVHRLGRIAVGEPSLLVRVEASHRGEAFAAAQFIIDELKKTVPIWKETVF